MFFFLIIIIIADYLLLWLRFSSSSSSSVKLEWMVLSQVDFFFGFLKVGQFLKYQKKNCRRNIFPKANSFLFKFLWNWNYSGIVTSNTYMEFCIWIWFFQMKIFVLSTDLQSILIKWMHIFVFSKSYPQGLTRCVYSLNKCNTYILKLIYKCVPVIGALEKYYEWIKMWEANITTYEIESICQRDPLPLPWCHSLNHKWQTYRSRSELYWLVFNTHEEQFNSITTCKQLTCTFIFSHLLLKIQNKPSISIYAESQVTQHTLLLQNVQQNVSHLPSLWRYYNSKKKIYWKRNFFYSLLINMHMQNHVYFRARMLSVSNIVVATIPLHVIFCSFCN